MSLNGQAGIQIRVHPSLIGVLAEFQKEVAVSIKKQFGLSEITVNGTMASEAFVAKHYGKKKVQFKIRKTGLNKGFIEFLN